MNKQLAYWRNPPAENSPESYHSDGAERSRMLVDILKNKLHFHPDRAILELGCNCGRNLKHLWDAGYRHLTGIDVNQDALDKMQVFYPNLRCCAMLGPIENVLPSILQPFGLVFTMAVLQHIPAHSESVFPEVARLAVNLLTIEDERMASWRHFPRNYREVFEPLGMEQVQGWRNLPDLGTGFVARLFRRAES